MTSSLSEVTCDERVLRRVDMVVIFDAIVSESRGNQGEKERNRIVERNTRLPIYRSTRVCFFLFFLFR